MLKKLATSIALMGVFAAPAMAGGFVNGGFEAGNTSGWTLGSGYVPDSTGVPNINPADYFAGGPRFDASASVVTITNAGEFDAYTGAATTYNGQHAVKLNDANPGYSVNVIKQTVSNYTDAKIVFEWNAVLQGSHGTFDADAFNLTLTDDTTGTVLLQKSYSSASAAGVFQDYNGWYSSNWQVESLDVSARSGHTFSLSLLASDCDWGGHAGYVYLDGFSSTQVPNAVPEPETYALMLAGLLAVGVVRRRQKRA